MARVHTEGFEMGDVIFWTAGGVIESTIKRSGGYSSKVNATAVDSNYKTITAAAEIYVRFAIYRNAAAHDSYMKWESGTTILGYFTIDDATKLCSLYTGTGTLVGTGTTVLADATWYLIELRIKIADSGNLELKIDGIAELTLTPDTKPGADTTISRLSFYVNDANRPDYVDDIAINDTSGGADNSWCGDGHIISLYPNGNGDAPSTAQLVGQDGNSTDNYLNVDEVPNDGDTTYNESATADNYDLYALTDHDNTVPQTIRRIWVEARAKDTVAAGGNCQVGIKSTTEAWSSDIPLLTTYTKQIQSTPATVNHDGGAAFSDANLDGLQIGFKAR